MDLLSIIIIGIGLSMDCFAVSISKGFCLKKFPAWPALEMALLFGLFQAIMPFIGYFAGKELARQFLTYNPWIAFILLGIVGGKMVIEGIKSKDPDCSLEKNPFKLITLLSLSVATSIDALATGIIFVPYPYLIAIAAAIIGIISFTFTLAGVYIGVHFGKRFHFKVEALGGVILIGIGLKILIYHLIS